MVSQWSGSPRPLRLTQHRRHANTRVRDAPKDAPSLYSTRFLSSLSICPFLSALLASFFVDLRCLLWWFLLSRDFFAVSLRSHSRRKVIFITDHGCRLFSRSRLTAMVSTCKYRGTVRVARKILLFYIESVPGSFDLTIGKYEMRLSLGNFKDKDLLRKEYLTEDEEQNYAKLLCAE